MSAPAGWLFAYFRQIYDGPVLVEQLHYALSGDGLRWEALNANRPVWRPVIDGEEHSIRDPFVDVGLDGRYHLLATHARAGWSHTDLVHASSADLLTWEDARLLPVLAGVPDAKNAWAPEFVRDPARGEHLVHWTTTTGPKVWVDKCIWCARTPDFRSFSRPRVLFDPGLNVIDSSIEQREGVFHLFFKPDSRDPEKLVRVATGRSLDGPYEIASGGITPAITEGPQPVRRDDLGGWLLYYDYPWENRYGVSFSPDLLAWGPLSGTSFPLDARHGSVVPLDAGQQARLERAFGG